jgi:hypothetical protein
MVVRVRAGKGGRDRYVPLADRTLTLAREYWRAYGRAAMLPSHRRALHDLSACRTAALGGHVSGCDHCGYEHFVYHSCRNRSCPQCHGAATAAWTAARIPELLPVPYFHVVFTVPSELREIIRAHQRLALGLLMSTAAESLQALAADPHYVGGTLGILYGAPYLDPRADLPSARALPRTGRRPRAR